MFFFFFKQKTAYEMRISDWSSDVCSSDLDAGDEDVRAVGHRVDVDLDGLAQVAVDQHRVLAGDLHRRGDVALQPLRVVDDLHGAAAQHVGRQLGRASGRERVCQYV